LQKVLSNIFSNTLHIKVTSITPITLSIPSNWTNTKSMFDSEVASAFQITFRAKIHANDVFSFFKNYFWYQHIKTIQNVQIILNFSKKTILNFLVTQVEPRSQTLSKSDTIWSWHRNKALLTISLKSPRKRKKRRRQIQ
jgi:hypothetical protein